MAKVQDDERRLRSALLKSFSVLALLVLPASAFCVIFAPELVDLLLGPKWHTAVVPFAILSGTLYFSLAWRNCATLFQALGHPYWLTAVLIFRAAALIAGIWWVAPHGLGAICGVIGVVMASMLGIMLVIVKHAIDLPLRRVAAAHFRPLVVTAAASGLCLTVKALLPELPGPALVILTLLFLLSSLSVFRLFQPGARLRLSTGPLRSIDPITEEDETHFSHRTHKTGTTALQRFSLQSSALTEYGFHYATPAWSKECQWRRQRPECWRKSNGAEHFLRGKPIGLSPWCRTPFYLGREFLRPERSRRDAAAGGMHQRGGARQALIETLRSLMPPGHRYASDCMLFPSARSICRVAL